MKFNFLNFFKFNFYILDFIFFLNFLNLQNFNEIKLNLLVLGRVLNLSIDIVNGYF